MMERAMPMMAAASMPMSMATHGLFTCHCNEAMTANTASRRASGPARVTGSSMSRRRMGIMEAFEA